MTNRLKRSESASSDAAALARLCTEAVRALATTSNPALLNAALETIDTLLAEARDELKIAVHQYQRLQQSALGTSAPHDATPASSSSPRFQWG